MKKRLLILVGMVLALCLNACRVRETYSLLHSTDEISSVYIAYVQFDDKDQVVQTERSKINDVDAFIDDFKKVACYTYFGDPVGPVDKAEVADVIKIVYDNGDYELIAYNGQAEYTQARGYNHYAGFSIFDEEQFMTLISNYLSD